LGLRADVWQPSALPQSEYANSHDDKRSDILSKKSTVKLHIETKLLSTRKQSKITELEIKPSC
jgi:hypothetical protein